MSRFRRFFLRLLNLLRPEPAERELARELSDHLALLEEEFQRRGMTPDDARHAARRASGGVEQTKERHRDARSFVCLEDVRRDARHALRGLARKPVFTLAVVLTLGLGIGATTAVFSVVRAVILRPLPYHDADRMVHIVENVPADESPSGAAVRTTTMNQDAYLWWRDRTQTLSEMAAFLTLGMTAQLGPDTVRVTVARVSPSLFAMFGTRPMAGRVFGVADDHSQVALLSARTWAQRFSSDPHAIGRSIALDGVSHIIVGVMTADFAFPSSQTEVWTPYGVEPSRVNRIDTVDVLAKLRDGVSVAAASLEANTIGNAFLGEPPPEPSEMREQARF